MTSLTLAEEEDCNTSGRRLNLYSLLKLAAVWMSARAHLQELRLSEACVQSEA